MILRIGGVVFMRMLVCRCVLLLLALAGLAAPASAQESGAPSGPIEVSYTGRYTMSVTTNAPAPRGRRANPLAGLGQAAAGGSTRQTTGTYFLELTFASSGAVSGRASGSGELIAVTLAGTRSNGRCRLVATPGNARFEGACSERSFEGTVTSPPDPRGSWTIAINLPATQVVDLARQAREQAEAQRLAAARTATTAAATSPTSSSSSSKHRLQALTITPAKWSCDNSLINGDQWGFREKCHELIVARIRSEATRIGKGGLGTEGCWTPVEAGQDVTYEEDESGDVRVVDRSLVTTYSRFDCPNKVIKVRCIMQSGWGWETFDETITFTRGRRRHDDTTRADHDGQEAKLSSGIREGLCYRLT